MLSPKDLLTQLATTLSAVRDGPQQVTAGQSVRVHIVPPSIDLQLPVVMNGNLNLTFLTKSVRFASALGVATPPGAVGPDLAAYLADNKNVLGGQPLAKIDIPLAGPPMTGAPQVPFPTDAPPPTLGTLPSLNTGTPTDTNTLSGVPGLLGQLVGAIPIPALAPVGLTVSWTVTRDGETLTDGHGYHLDGGGSDVQFVFEAAFKELTTSGLPTSHFEITADITLTLGSDSVGPLALPPVAVDVPAIGIPTLAALFTQPKFGGVIRSGSDVDDNDVLIFLPRNSPIAGTTDSQTAVNTLNQLIGTLTTTVNGVLGTPLTDAATAAELALFLASLAELGQVVGNLARTPSQHPVQIFVANADNGIRDLGDIKYDPDDADFGAQINSALLIGVKGVKLRLWNQPDYTDDPTLTFATGAEMVIGLPSFDTESDLTHYFPAGVTGQVDHTGQQSDISEGDFRSTKFAPFYPPPPNT